MRIRVLTPKESDAIYNAITKDKFKVAYDIALHTGMRYNELKAFSVNPEWHLRDKYEIYLPSSKHPTIKRDRHVHLTEDFNKLLSVYLKNGVYFPDRRTWFDSIRRWSQRAGIEDYKNINVKTTRKTWECWLMRAGYDPIKILLNQGHTQSTAILHYLNMSFTKDEIEDIKKKTITWTG